MATFADAAEAQDGGGGVEEAVRALCALWRVDEVLLAVDGLARLREEKGEAGAAALRAAAAAETEEGAIVRALLQCEQELGTVRRELTDTEAAGDSSSDAGGWTLFSDTRGIRTHTRVPRDVTHCAEFKIAGRIRADVFSVLACFYETELFQQWIPACSASYNVSNLSRFRRVIALYMQMPWPLAVRGVLAVGYGDVCQKTGDTWVYVRSLEDGEEDAVLPGGSADLPAPPRGAAKDVVRLGVRGGFRIRRVDDANCDVTCVLSIDPKINLPKMFVSYVASNFCYLLLPFLRRHARRFVEGNEHHHLIAENVTIYAEVHRRLERAGVPVPTHEALAALARATEDEVEEEARRPSREIDQEPCAEEDVLHADSAEAAAAAEPHYADALQAL